MNEAAEEGAGPRLARRALLRGLAAGALGLAACSGRPAQPAPVGTTPATPAVAPATATTGAPASTAAAAASTGTASSVSATTATGGGSTASTTAGSSSAVIEVAAGNLVVRVRPPWSLEASAGGTAILRELAGAPAGSPYGTLTYQRAGSDAWQHVTGVLGVEPQPKGVRIRVATSEAGAAATVELTPVGDGAVRVDFQPPPEAPVAWTGFAVASDESETLLGLGERFDGLSLAGRRLDLWIADRREAKYGSSSYLLAPWLLSSRGFGFYLEDPRRTVWELRSARRDAWAVRTPGPGLVWYLFAGPPAVALQGYAGLTGRPAAPPSWGFGVVKTLVGGEQRVLADAARLKAAKVPVDGVFVYDVVDEEANVGWPGIPYDAIPRGPYPDVRRLTAGLRSLGFRPLGYFSPDFRPERSSYAEAAKRGFLVKGADGKPWLSPLYKISEIDATNPEAVTWWRDSLLKRALVDLGFDGGMFDLGEAIPADARFAGGLTGASVHNRFPVYLATALDGALRAYKPDGLFWMRSGFSGAQAYERATWSGDPVHNWEPVTGFQSLLPAALGAGLSAFPYWHTEVGGFVEGGLAPAAERELYLRWLQLGAFTTMLRDEYGDRRGHPTDIWTDAQTLGLWRRYARLHQALRPYLERSAAQARQNGLPLMRHLALAYPDDPRAWVEQQQYLLGDDLLVAPVVVQGAVSRSVYLPAGEWREWWTGAQHQGPGDVTVAAPVDRIPLFVRAGVPSPLPDPSSISDEA